MPDVKKRVRSPNYPALGLVAALQQTEKLFAKIETHPAGKDVTITGLGYGSYNGASAGALSAQLKYGLVAKVGEDYKLTDRALAILHPRNRAEKADAIRAAAKAPSLFSELLEHFHGTVPNDDLLRSHLIRKGFAQGAITPLIQAFRETVELVSTDSKAHDAASSGAADAATWKSAAKVGNYVQWTSQGVEQFRHPRRVVWTSDDGTWLRVEGSETGIAMTEVQVTEAQQGATPDLGSMAEFEKSRGYAPDRHSIVRVLIDGDHLQVNATIFDRKGVEKLIRTLNANKELLDEEVSLATTDNNG